MAEEAERPPPEKTEPELPYVICERMKESLFRVSSYFGSGAGFVVYKGRQRDGSEIALIATAHHVVQEAVAARAEIVFRHETSVVRHK